MLAARCPKDGKEVTPPKGDARGSLVLLHAQIEHEGIEIRMRAGYIHTMMMCYQRYRENWSLVSVDGGSATSTNSKVRS
jgi:hypothetical protein